MNSLLKEIKTQLTSFIIFFNYLVQTLLFYYYFLLLLFIYKILTLINLIYY